MTWNMLPVLKTPNLKSGEGALLEQHRNVFFLHKSLVHPASNADLCVLAVSVNEELTRVGACTESAGRHGCSLFSPAVRDSSTIRLNGKELGNDVLPVSGTDGFGMELNTVKRKGWVTQPHDESRGRFRSVDHELMLLLP